MWPGISRSRRLSLSWYLIRGMILVVVATVLVGGVPALAATWSQLERQVWERIEKDQAATMALYDGERERIRTVAALATQRPTLCTLVRERDFENLSTYLSDLERNTNIDWLVVIGSGWQVTGRSTVGLPSFAPPPVERERPYVEYVVTSNPSRVLIVAQTALDLLPGCQIEPTRLVAVRVLDDDFMRRLDEQTGLAQSLIVGDQRVATSLFAAPGWPLDPTASERVVSSRTACCTRGTSQREMYYVGLTPLMDNSGQVIALSEVALPGGAIRARMRVTIALLLGLGLAVAVGGSLVAAALTRRITEPLASLREAADRLGAGDLDTPISSPSHLAEIDHLARQLSYARRRLRQARDIARREKQRVERYLQATREGIVTLDERGRITSMSSEAERLLGRSMLNVLDEHYLTVFRPAPDEVLTMADLISPPPGAPPVHRLTILDGQDQPITLEVTLCWLDSDLPPDHLRERVVVLRDVSEEEALIRLRSDFLANVSHEFRTPLSAVMATNELLIEEGHNLTPEELAELTGAIHMGTLNLQTLVDNLLESTSIEAGSFRVSCRTIHLDSVIDTAVKTMSPLLKRRRQNVVRKIEGCLPTLYADPDRLGQVFINLLANASKFCPMGQPIIVVAQQTNQTIRVAVLDSGPGLPAGRYGDLFKRFVTGRPSRGAQYGVGLGLSVVKAIVEAHGGEVGAHNRPEGGAEVWFTLPIRPSPDNPPLDDER